MALVIVAVMTMMYAVPMSVLAEDTTISVVFYANGGTISGSNTVSETVDSTKTTITIPEVTSTIPDVAAPNGKIFDFWGTSENATKATETGVATINEGTANFYAIWKDAPAVANRTGDAQISVSGLETGDVVKFYRVLEFDQNATKTGGWKATSAFAYDETNNTDGLKEADIQRILGLDSTGKRVVNNDNKDQYGINEALADRIGKMAAFADSAYSNINEVNGTATQTPVVPGLYMASITPGQAGVLYNPVFVGADYDTNTTNSWTVDMSDSYSPASRAKKSKIVLNKTASTTESSFEDSKPESVAAGDTINFTVDTTIPEFGDDYTQAVFKVTDKVSDGLTYNGDVKVYLVKTRQKIDSQTNEEVTDPETGDAVMEEYEEEVTASATTFTLTTNNDGAATPRNNGYVVDFKTAYILGLTAATPIRLKYSATVSTDAPRSINLEDNTVTVNFSNNPSDNTGKGKLKDETKHYTFDIDANIFGPAGDGGQGVTPWHTAEAVKIGVDENGNEITRTTTLHGQGEAYENSPEQTIGALEGAEFKLYVVDTAAAAGTTTEIKDNTGTAINVVPYINNFITSSTKIVSDSTGRLTIQGQTTPGIRGLDIGTYYLLETQAPEGYIKEQNAVKIEVYAPQTRTNATTGEEEFNDTYWSKTTYTETSDDGLTYTWDVLELKKYEIKINGDTTATYNFTNQKTTEGSNPTGSVDKGDTVVGAHGAIESVSTDAQADDGKIVNKQGVEMPSTGGIGTTLFYLIGAILIIGAGVLLVTRRRASANEE